MNIELDEERTFNRTLSCLINRIRNTDISIIKVRWHQEKKDAVEIMHARFIDGRFEENPRLSLIRLNTNISKKSCHSFSVLDAIVESIKEKALS